MWLLKSIQGGLVWSVGVGIALEKLFDRLLHFFCDEKNLNFKEIVRSLFQLTRTPIVI
jgi:hypothetical protein